MAPGGAGRVADAHTSYDSLYSKCKGLFDAGSHRLAMHTWQTACQAIDSHEWGTVHLQFIDFLKSHSMDTEASHIRRCMYTNQTASDKIGERSASSSSVASSTASTQSTHEVEFARLHKSNRARTFGRDDDIPGPPIAPLKRAHTTPASRG